MEQEEWGIEPIDEQVIVDSINHYNEVCTTGGDTDFGKRADYMVAIEQGPSSPCLAAPTSCRPSWAA